MRNFLSLFILIFLTFAFNSEAAKITDNILTIGDKSAPADISIKSQDGGFLKKNNGGDWVFSNDGLLEKAIGSGAGGGAGGIISLDNPGFEDGFDKEWTCTATKCTEETTSPLVLTKSLKFTPTLQNDEFRSTSKAILDGLKGTACEARVFYLGGDENLAAKVVDGNGDLVGTEEVLKAHPIASYESIFFLCPSASEITGDAQKGNLSLVVYNKTATPAAVATFDEMYLGSLIGLVETVLPDVLGARIANNGAASITSTDTDWIDSVTRVSAGVVDVVFSSGIFTVIPSITITADSGNANFAYITTISTSGFSVRTITGAGTLTDENFSLKAKKQGADAKQTVQVYKSIPKVAQNVNDFHAKVSTSGIVSLESIDFFDGNCTAAGACNFNAGIFSELPNCFIASSVRDHIFCSMIGLSTTTMNYECRNSAGTVLTDTTDVEVTCHKTGSDFKMPTAQIILVNQMQTTNQDGATLRTCYIQNNGTASYDTSDPACGFIDSVVRIAIGNVGINTSLNDDFVKKCVATPINTVSSWKTPDGTGGYNWVDGDFSIYTRNHDGTDHDRDFTILCTPNR